MAGGDDRRIEEEQPSRAGEQAQPDVLGWLLFLMSGVRFQQTMVQQAVHYAEQVLPTEEDDQGERACLAAAQARIERPTGPDIPEVEQAASLISANVMDGIPMVKAACHALWAAQADAPLEAAQEATRAVEDAAGRKASRGEGDYMGRAVARRAGMEMAQQWQVDAAWVLVHEDVYDEELPPFPPLPLLPEDPRQIVALFKEIYSEEDAYRARDLTVLLDFMSGEQQLRFKQAIIRQAISYTEPLLPPPEEDQGERPLLSAVRQWADEQAEENARALDALLQVSSHATPGLQWTFLWAADTQAEPHAIPSVAYLVKAAQSEAKSALHEVRMTAAELAQARARQWQAAAATAIAQEKEPPDASDRLKIVTGTRGAYLEGRLALLIQRMTAQQRLAFKRRVVRRAVEEAERVLPPEARDRGHRRCLEAACLWLDEPSEEYAKAAWSAAWLGIEKAPTYRDAPPAEVAAWLAAQSAAQAAGQADIHKAALHANVLASVEIAMQRVPATSKAVEQATQRMKNWHLEVAWRILQGEEPPQGAGEGALRGESFGALIERMGLEQLEAMARMLERQARWYGERAGGPAPETWLERQAREERLGGTSPAVAGLWRGLENQVESALSALEAARASRAEEQLSTLRRAAESVWKAAALSGERRAREWQVEAAWAALHDRALPALDIDVL